jgi:O-antigen/teichoic acid export membrane protein
MNVAAYLFTLVAARRLGPEGFSVVAALMGVVLIVNVLALGVQATAARRVARADTPDMAGRMTVTAVRAALALGVVCLALSPVAAVVLRLDTWLTAATVSVTAAALTVTGVQLGILQGRRNWQGFAGLSVAMGAGRLLVGGAAVVLWPTPLGAMAGVAIGAVVPTLVGHRLAGAGGRPAPVRTEVPTSPSEVPGEPIRLLREVAHDSHTLLAFFALTQVDVFAARVILPADEAGTYAAGLIVSKAVLFLPTFVTVMAFPALARRAGSRHLHLFGLAVVLGIGVLATVMILAVPDLALAFVGGAAYAAVQPDLWLFALLGTVTAMIQLLVQTALARTHRKAVWWIWGALALVAAGVPFVATGHALLLLVLGVDAALLAVLVRVTWSDAVDTSTLQAPLAGVEPPG